MRYFTMLSSVIFVGMMMAACSSGGDSLACDVTVAGAETCIETSGDIASGATCPAPTKAVDSCPTANALGTCTVTQSAGGASVTAATTYYKATGLTADSLKTACTTAGGTWE